MGLPKNHFFMRSHISTTVQNKYIKNVVKLAFHKNKNMHVFLMPEAISCKPTATGWTMEVPIFNLSLFYFVLCLHTFRTISCLCYECIRYQTVLYATMTCNYTSDSHFHMSTEQ